MELYSSQSEVVTNYLMSFSTVGASAAAESKSLAKINDLPSYEHPANQSVHEAEQFQFHVVNSVEIQRIVHSFPSNKTPGKDKLSMGVIKDAFPVIPLVLADIVNTSLLASTWK